MKKIKELARAEYVPTDEDIFRSWIRTTGIHEFRIKTERCMYHFFEPSGEGTERNKWTYLFNATAYDCMWYVAAISGYNQETFSSGRVSNWLKSFLTRN